MKLKKKKMPRVEEDAFIREINEDLKNDNMRLIWKKYGVYIVSAVVVILTITVSFETIKAWRVKRYQTWSDTYAYALALQKQGAYDESLKVLENIQESGSNIYADLAEVHSANILFEQGKKEEGLARLEEIAKDTNLNKKLRDASAMKLVSYKMDEAPAEEIIALLTPLMQEGNSWYLEAKEMMALLLVREGDAAKAKAIYGEIADATDANDNLKSRAKDMLAALD